MRDDFTKSIIAEIAKGAGYRCSNPKCARVTVGANAQQDATITIGVAAHIYAASPGGPRYNPAQTQEARRAKDNGIWLCQSCGRLIDADPKEFTVTVLTEWKRTAQERAFRELVAPVAPASTDEAARIGSIIAAANAAASDQTFEQLFVKVHAAAGTDLAGYRRGAIWSGEVVELTLRLYDEEGVPPFRVGKLPSALEVAPEVAIIAPPGTGKTTTLLQLAGHLLAANSVVPLYFRLGDWSAGSSRLLASLQERAAFRDLRQEDDLLEIARRGRLLLLLDGWNELDAAAQKRLRIELEQLRRDCPFLRIIITTRQQILDVPVSGPRVAIDPLSEDQQMAMARAVLGTTGEKIVDNAWRTPGVRELIATPLYLSALLSVASQGASPTTKEEVLRLFVQQHEQAASHAETLQATLFGCHREVLTALASHLNANASTATTEAEVRRIVAATLAHLRAQGQLTGQLEPVTVVDTLTSHHTLVRSAPPNGVISFQHQQFQEWFASHEVENLMRCGAAGDADARTQLRVAVLDQPAWEESILFAAERLSREDGSAEIIAHALRLTLSIDPMLAAEMIYRSSAAVWEAVKADILAFVNRWHRPGTVDRAVRFMIISGRSEFASLAWPLASSDNSQIQLPTLRTAPRFRPSVLGPNLQEKVALLPEATREHLLALIAYESGVDGMDLATQLAKADPSSKVQAEVVMYLLHRRADRHAGDLLSKAHDGTWERFAKRAHADEIRDPAVAARLRSERDKLFGQATDPLQRLGFLIEQSADHPGRDEAIGAAIADARFPVGDQQARTSLHLAQERAPAAFRQGLRQRLEAGLELPFRASHLFAQMEVVDDGAIAAAIIDVTRNNRDINDVAVLAGPKIAGALIDKYLAAAHALQASRTDRSLGDQYHRLRARIGATRAPSFVPAVIERADTNDAQVISSLASLVSLHGDDDDHKASLPVDPILKPRLLGMLRGWVEAVMASPAAGRHDLCEVGNAIGRFGFSELLPELQRLLDEDLVRLKKARDGFTEARRRGDIQATSDASMRYDNQYRQAFIRLGGDKTAAVAAAYLEDRLFGFDAAVILKAISDKQLGLPAPPVHRQWPRFGGVAAARAARAPKPEPSNTFALPIFAAIDHLARPETDKDGQLLAIQMARIALAMPHSDQDALIARVVDLPQPLKAKWELLAAIVLDGQVLDVNPVMQAIDEWLAEASQNEQTAWHKRQNTWEIEPWLELLPFTTRPSAVIEGLTKVKSFYGRGWRQRWERVLTAVAALPGPEGEALLGELARAHRDIAGEFEWMKGILGRDSASAVLLFTDLAIEGVFGADPHGPGAWHVGRELAAYVRKFPELKAELKKRYESSAVTGPARAAIEHFFGEAGDEDDLIAMIAKYSANGQPYDSPMAAVVRAVALRHEPVEDGSSSFYIHPASVKRIRKLLFRLLGGPAQEAALARRCLTAIDILRDEHGIAADDTRHPDVLSGAPWPLETMS